MEHGGSYERDAAVGGYDRKELRGLGKQAKSGTLTQRERARYNYLKDERGGRRKRGLLAGLGGAGAVLAGLAASGKLGGGGGEGGSALMDAIKGRLVQRPRKLQKMIRGVQEKNLQNEISKDQMNAAMSGDIPKFGDYDPNIEDIDLIEEEEFPSSSDDELRETPAADIISESMDEARGNDAQEVLGSLKAMSNRDKNPRVTDDRDFSDILSEDVGEGDLYEAQQEEERQARLSRRPTRGTDDRDFSGELSEELGEGDLYEAKLEQERQARLSRRPEFAPGGGYSMQDRLDAIQSGVSPEKIGASQEFPNSSNRRPIESSNNQPPAVDPNDALKRIIQKTGQRPVRANSVDPMGIIQGESRDENVSEAQREEDAVSFLYMLNKGRVEQGLPEVNKITMEAIKETGRSTSELMNFRPIGQIPTNRPAGQILKRYN